MIKLDHTQKNENGLKKSNILKIQLAIVINFMHSKNDKTEIMINDKADKFIEKLF